MSKKPAEPKKEETKPKRRRSVLLSLPILVLAVVFVALLGRTAMLVLGGLLPTIAAGMTDRSLHRFRTKAIFALNFSGLAPSLAKILQQGNVDKVAQDMMGDSVVWLTVYGAAALGWCIVWLAPLTAHHLLAIYAQIKVEQLDDVQKKYVEEWGNDVTHWPPRS